jgi:hypothetical protein
MPLIEEKIGIGFAGVYPDNRCARSEKCFTLRRNETATFARLLYNRAGRVSRMTWCHYHFPEIKSSEFLNYY